MTRFGNNGVWSLSLASVMAVIGVLTGRTDPTLAQIVPDQTLGAQRSQVTPNVDVPGGLADRIDGGAIRGVNLFHSFREFNVGELQRVYFANPAGIENILGRVTGTNRSDILGTLGVDGGANLFLINPNGIVFGPNAQLDIRGSFVAGTADKFTFPDGSEFRATNPNAPPLVTVNIPIGLQYGSEPPAALVSEADLAVGRDLLLSGGSVTITGNIDTSSTTGNGGNVTITSTEGNVSIENSIIRTNTIYAKDGLPTNAGDITIETPSAISLTNSSLDAGSIGARGSGGNIILRGVNNLSATSVALDNSNLFSDTSSTETSGIGGNISIIANSISLVNQSLIDATTNGNGQGGNIALTAIGNEGSIALANNSSIRTLVGVGAGGSGGNIEVQARSISLTDGGRFEARTFGDRTVGTQNPQIPQNPQSPVEENARAGNIKIDILGSDTEDPNSGEIITPAFDISGFSTQEGFSSGLFTSSETENSGRGGNITLNFLGNGSLRVSDGGVLSAQTQGNSPGGNITIGDEANPNNNPAQVELRNGGQLIATSSGAGTAGNIKINASDSVTISGSDSNFAQRNRSTPINANGIGEINEREANDTVLGAHNLDFSEFLMDENPDVQSSELIPYISINGTGNGSFDYYSFEITDSNTIGIFDIDYGKFLNNPDTAIDEFNLTIDTEIFLFRENSQGEPVTTLLAENDDFPELAGAGGSQHRYDSFLRYTFREPGTYVIGVGEYDSTANDNGIEITPSNTPDIGDSYTLQVSLGSSRLLNQGLSPNQGSSSGIFAQSTGTGLGGTVTINTNGALSLTDNSRINTAVRTGSTGTDLQNIPGSIDITAGSVSLSNGSSLNASISGSGQGGRVTINAGDGEVSLTGDSTIRTTVGLRASGSGGDVNIQSGSFSLTEGARVESGTQGTQTSRAGNITVDVSGADSVDPISGEKIPAFRVSGISQASRLPSGLLTASELPNSGQGGNITVNASNGTARISEGAVLDARTRSASAGGNIEVNVNEFEVIDGGQLLTTAFQQGRAGDIRVNATTRTLISGVAPPLTEPVSQFTTQQVTVLNILNDLGLTFEIASNSNVVFSETIPHVPIEGTGNGNFAYYSFSVGTAGSLGIFDIDEGYKLGQDGSIDTQLFLFNQDTGALLASNDDNYLAEASTNGSTSGLDAFISHVFDLPGNYVIGVGEYYSFASNGTLIEGNAPDGSDATNNIPADTYTLHISVENPRSPDATEPILNSGLFSQTQGTGAAGNVTITTGELIVRDQAQVSAATSASGQGGNLSVVARDSVTVSAQGRLSAEATDTATGNAGSVDISTRQLTVEQGSQVLASTVSETSTSDGITLRNLETLQVSGGSQISASTERGTAGNLSINAGQVAAQSVQVSGQDSRVAAQATESGGNAGSVTLNAQQLTVTDNAQVLASNISGESRDITLQGLERLEVTGGGQISASTESRTAGSLSINVGQEAAESVLLSGQGSRLSAQATESGGNAGSVTLNAQQLTVTDNAQVLASNISGESRDITLQGLERLEVTGGGQISASTESRTAGSLSINVGQEAAESVLLSGQGSRLSAQATESGGNAGSVTLNAQQLTVTDNAQVLASNISGESRDITLQGLERLEVTGGGQISASTESRTAGSLSINVGEPAAESVLLSGQGSRLSAQATEAGGNAGSVTLNAQQLTVTDNAQILASNISGESRDITLQGLDSLQVTSGGEISASTRNGIAGSLSINVGEQAAESVLVRGNSELSVAATGDNTNSESGQVTINARELTVEDGSTISAATNAGQGRGVQLQNLERLSVNNSLISSSTISGVAGDVIIDASNSVTLTGTFTPSPGSEPQGGVVAAATTGGRAGSVTINTGDLLIRDGAEVSVSSPSGIAGNVNVNADFIGLNQGSITAEAGQGEGGANIDLNASGFLRLDNESLISALATGSATGGNININAQYVIASFPTGKEGNDIVADAVLGNGGRITINALGIFGLDFRLARTPLNDITASSQGGAAGTVQITTLGIDPSRGLAALPLNFIDVSGLVGGQCSASGADGELSQFTIIGRGGLPLNPTDPLAPEAEASDWVTFDPESDRISPQAHTPIRITPFTSSVSPQQLAQFPSLCYQSWSTSAIAP